jgi:hypothetical protein
VFGQSQTTPGAAQQQEQIRPQLLSTLFAHLPLVRPEKGANLGNLTFLRTMLFPFPTFHNCDWPNTFELSYITDTFLPLYYLIIHLNQFSHPEDGGSVLLRNIRIFDHYMVQNPEKDRHLICNCRENLKA